MLPLLYVQSQKVIKSGAQLLMLILVNVFRSRTCGIVHYFSGNGTFPSKRSVQNEEKTYEDSRCFGCSFRVAPFLNDRTFFNASCLIFQFLTGLWKKGIRSFCLL